MKTFWLIVADDLLQLIPYAVLCGYPFKDSFRFSRRKTVVITLLLTSVLSAVDGVVNVCLEKTMPNDLSLTNASYSVFLGLIAICFWWYLYAVKEILQKKLFIFSFTLLSALIINSLCNIVMNLTRDNFSFVPANQWTIATGFIVTIPAVLLLCLFIKFFYMPIENGMSNKEIGALSMPLLMMFAVFSAVFWFMDEFFMIDNPTVLLLYFGAITALFVLYAVIFRMYRLASERHLANEKYMQSQYQVNIRDEQYRRIFESIEGMNKQRHDIRHHMLIMQELLDNGETEKASDYLKQYLDSSRKKTAVKLCGNPIVNMIVSHYRDIAEKLDISFSIRISIPDKLPIQDIDISVLLGNLLENAMEAVSAADLASREVKLNMGCRGKMLGITVDNSFNGVVYKRDGKYFSTKSEHRGLGLDSISDIAEKYHGGVEFRHDEKMFYSSIMLGLDESGKY